MGLLTSSNLKMTKKFNLKWNDFQSNVTTTCGQFRNRNHFQDVTLVSDDYVQISAHRIVLSACSGYFNNVLSQNTHSHPLLCLNGIYSSELNNVLDFIYSGELQIHQAELDRFLQIAQRLQLQGHLSSEEDDQKEKTQVLCNLESENYSESDLPIQKKGNKIYSMNSEDFQSIEELDSYINQQILRNKDGPACKLCNKKARIISHIKEHVEIHIKGLSFNCDFCGNTLKSRKSLRLHKYQSCKLTVGINK